jgi:hypothetical protein
VQIYVQGLMTKMVLATSRASHWKKANRRTKSRRFTVPAQEG